MTNPLHASLLVGLVLGACRPPLDPPDSVEEMVVFAFREFATEGAVELVANDVHAWTDAHEEDAREGWFVADLTPEDLADVEGVAGPLDGLIGALGLATYRSDLDPVLEAITSPDKATIRVVRGGRPGLLPVSGVRSVRVDHRGDHPDRRDWA